LVGAFGIAGGISTLYEIFPKLPIWLAKRAALIYGLTVGAVLGLRSAALAGKKEEEKCEADIPDKCKQYKS